MLTPARTRVVDPRPGRTEGPADGPAADPSNLNLVATQVKLDPELQRIVERARAAARERGELVDGPSGIAGDDLSPEARAALADWVASGDYDRIVAEITADDPDIATQ